MKKLIQEWLMDQLGIVIDFNKVNFAKKVRDGYLISQVLCGFEVISKEELSFVKPTEDKEEAFTNFVNYILIWLGRLNITIKDSELNDIINEKGNSGMNLFYELYLALQSKSKLHFITQRLILEKSRNSDAKFEVDKVKESLLQDMKFESGINCGLLVANADIIKWHKDRLIALNKHCEQARADYMNYFKAKQSRKPKAVCACKTYCPCPKPQEKVEQLDFPEESSEDFTFQELVESYEQSKQIETVKPDYNEAKKVMRQLKTKRFEAKQKEIQKTQLHTELCDEFWKDTIRKQENAIQELVDEKILSQSFYERQMISKMLQVKHQQEVIKENRQFINDEIMKQKENDVINKLIMDQRLTDECACDFIYEKGRIEELHRRVYAEKLRLKKERIEKICRETAEDLVNFAIRLGEFEDEYHDQPSRRRYDDWVSLFVSCGSILPKVVPAEDILQDLSDLPEEEEELFLEEIERQEILDNKDFEKYLNNEWPWTLKNFSQFNIKFDLIDRGLNILGYIVHRLLLAKYPKTPLLPKPDFKFDYSVCVNGIIEPAVVEKLQSLLSFKEIEVFEVLNAVDYCLGKYSAEQNLLEIDDVQSEDIREVKEMKKGKNRSKLQKGKKGKIVKDSTTEPSYGSFSTSGKLHMDQHMKHNKKFQTPKIFPCEDFKISQAAHLGEIAQGILEQGEPLTDFLLAAMIVEYLYSIIDKKGWVLINFPSNYNQAMTLEENLSSTPLCKDITAIKSIMDLAELEKKSAAEAIQKEKDMKRSSKIFPLPKKIKEADVYDTELTAYIKIMKSHVSDVEQAESTLPPISRYLDESTDPLEKFYADQGCHYYFYYETFDYETLKYLARLIIGDFSLPRKPSIELFGRVVLLAEEEHPDRSTTTLAKVSKDVTTKEKNKKKLVIQKETTVEKSVDKSKKGKGKGKGKSKGKGKKKGGLKRRKKMSTLPKTFESKHVQAPPLEDIYEIVIEEDDPTIQPGEDKWKFIELPMSEDLMIILATLCENMENIYMEDFKQVLFMRRMAMNEVQPFISHTKSHLLEFIHRPDDRQQILHEFQMTFNSISECLRQDDEVKAELHCRADELRKALFTTSEANIKKSFSERERIIEQHWLRKQLHDLTQIYICGLQLELDRCIDTFNLITDYYVCGITNKPPEDSYFQKEIIKVPEEDSVYCFQQYTQWEDAFDTRYFKDELSNKVEQALDFAEKTKSNALKVITATQGKFALGKPKMDRRKGKKVSAVAPLPDIVKDNLDKIMEEWKTALDAEFERLYLRLQLIRRDGGDRLKEMSNKVKEMMNEIYGMIRKRYNNEQSSIEQLCDVISNAIENETTIQQELLIDRDHFYAQPDVLLFPDDLPPPPQPVKEWKKESVFTIEQLQNLHRVLLNLAPSGIIPERTFAYLLQDMLVQDAEDGREQLAPELWLKLTTFELEKVLLELFCKAECIHWKDFIVYNFMVQMPSVETLLDLKRNFQKKDLNHTGNVSVAEFKTFTFWFEEGFSSTDESDMKRLSLMKELMCDMYKVNENTVNYMAMLFDFCKDHNGTVGFAKALSLILDRPVCWDSNIGKKYVQHVKNNREHHEKAVTERNEEILENKTMVTEVLEAIADEIVHQCDSVVITEVITPNSFEHRSLDGEGCDDQCICSSQCFCAREIEHFSNIAVDFEASFDPSLVYFLDLESIFAVEAVILQWHTQVQNVYTKSFREQMARIYRECKNPFFNNAVLAHEFLNNYEFSQILAYTTRFIDKNPPNFVQNLIIFRKN